MIAATQMPIECFGQNEARVLRLQLRDSFGQRRRLAEFAAPRVEFDGDGKGIRVVGRSDQNILHQLHRVVVLAVSKLLHRGG